LPPFSAPRSYTLQGACRCCGSLTLSRRCQMPSAFFPSFFHGLLLPSSNTPYCFEPIQNKRLLRRLHWPRRPVQEGFHVQSGFESLPSLSDHSPLRQQFWL